MPEETYFARKRAAFESTRNAGLGEAEAKRNVRREESFELKFAWFPEI